MSAQAQGVEIIAKGSSIKVLVDDKPVFSVTDESFSHGTIGLYCYCHAGSSFDDVVVDDLASGAVLLSEDFNRRTHLGWTFISERTARYPSQWSAASGALAPSVRIDSPDSASQGTYALYTRRSWQDYRVSLKVRYTDGDPIGVAFRFQDSANYYRFSWDRKNPGRRLFKKENGAFKLLAEDAVPYVPARNYRLEIIAQGSSLNVSVDGSQVFSVIDQTHGSGTIALHYSYDAEPYFDDLLVEEARTKGVLLAADFDKENLSGWKVFDEVLDDPTIWSARTVAIIQRGSTGSDTFALGRTFLVY
jgi:hypothetical protein